MTLHDLTRVLVRLAKGDPDIVVLDKGDPDPGHEDGGLRGGDALAEVSEQPALDQSHSVRFALGCDNVNKLQDLLAKLIVVMFTKYKE